MFAFLKFLGPALLAFAAGLYAAHRWDAGDLAACRLAEARARAAAVSRAAAIVHAQDAVSLSAAVAEARAQRHLAAAKSAVPKEVHAHVPPSVDRRICIPWGLVRVLDAAATGADPDSVSRTARQPDDACAPVTASRLAGAVADNYITARRNAEQLNALEAWIGAEGTAASQPAPQQ